VDESYHFNGKHISEYDRTKASAHDVAKELIAKGLPLVIVMPGLIYGPGDTSTLRDNIISFLKRQLPAVPDQTGYCWAHVDDVAQGHSLAMEKGTIGESYIIAGEPHSLVGAFKLASEITGKPAPKTISDKTFRLLSRLVKPFDGFLPPTYTSEGLRVVAGVTYWGDNGKARRELGYNPRPLREGWGETLLHEMKFLGMNQS
jgi:nucleoside-diphosphate-sugar epimerase